MIHIKEQDETIMKLYEGKIYSINHGRHCVRRKFIKTERGRQIEDVLPGQAGGGGVRGDVGQLLYEMPGCVCQESETYPY